MFYVFLGEGELGIGHMRVASFNFRYLLRGIYVSSQIRQFALFLCPFMSIHCPE